MGPEQQPPDWAGAERRKGYPPASADEVQTMRLSQESLDRSVRGLQSQLRSLDSALRDYVPRRELAEGFPNKNDLDREKRAAQDKRRMIAEGAALGVILTIQGHDLHVEHCRPVQLDGTIGTPIGATRTICDVTFPFDGGHAADDHAYTAANHAGILLYAVLIAALFLDLTKHRRKAKEADSGKLAPRPLR